MPKAPISTSDYKTEIILVTLTPIEDHNNLASIEDTDTSHVLTMGDPLVAAGYVARGEGKQFTALPPPNAVKRQI